MGRGSIPPLITFEGHAVLFCIRCLETYGYPTKKGYGNNTAEEMINLMHAVVTTSGDSLCYSHWVEVVK